MTFFDYFEYQQRCADAFDRHRVLISKILPDARIEHIGSSAVPGAVSKGDLDIFIGVSPSEHEDAVAALISCGFSEHRNTLRTNELCMLMSPEPDVSLQVVANASEFEFFIIFRDVLRSSPDILNQYNQLKRSCEVMDQDDYRKIKSEFIEDILRCAYKNKRSPT